VPGSEPTGLPPTERRNPASTGLSDLPALRILELMNDEDARAIAAVRPALPALAALAEDAAERIGRGGAVHYFGAGTSGRLGVLDAAELRPTFSLDPGIVTGHLAGGPGAMTEAVEGGEDSDADGEREASALGRDDLAIGIAASGTTPYVAGALRGARAAGAATALICNNPGTPLADLADHLVVLDTGPEVLTGSTRLKAGTAQKVALNGFSTTLMVLLGRTWSNLMVTMSATNAKLRLRAVRILVEASECTDDAARAALEQTGGDLRAALDLLLEPAG
jgi:N-acetylmuramic acid 6-phosphate etherase